MRWHPRLELYHEVRDVEDGDGEKPSVARGRLREAQIGSSGERCSLLAC